MVRDLIYNTANHYGLNPDYFYRAAQLESGLDPSAKNPTSSAGGLFQQIDSNWNAYGNGGDRYDAYSSAEAAAKFWQENQRHLKNTLGRDPEGWEMYMAHQQGPGGAAKILAGDPNRRAVDVLGHDQVTLNGGNADMTMGDFAGLWRSKFEGGGYVGNRGGPQDLLEGDFLPPPVEPQLTSSKNTDTLQKGLEMMGIGSQDYMPWFDPEIPPGLGIKSKTDDYIYSLATGKVPSPALTLAKNEGDKAKKKEEETTPDKPYDPWSNDPIPNGSPNMKNWDETLIQTPIDWLNRPKKVIPGWEEGADLPTHDGQSRSARPGEIVDPNVNGTLDPSKVVMGTPGVRPTNPGEVEDPNVHGAPLDPSNGEPVVRPQARPAALDSRVSAKEDPTEGAKRTFGQRAGEWLSDPNRREAMLALGTGLLSATNMHDGLGAGFANIMDIREGEKDRDHDYQLQDMRDKAALDRAEISGATGYGSRPQRVGDYKLIDGTTAPGVWFDPIGKKYYDAAGRDVSELLEHKINASDAYGTKGQMTTPQANAVSLELVNQRNTLETFDKVYQGLSKAEYGVPGFVTDMKYLLETMRGSGLLTDEMMTRKLTQAELQGLVGRSRTEVVGPGVMTEQDAARVIMALGGDMQSIFSNPQVGMAQIARMREKLMLSYNQQYDQYSAMVAAYPNIPYITPERYQAPDGLYNNAPALDQSKGQPDDEIEDILKQYE